MTSLRILFNYMYRILVVTSLIVMGLLPSRAQVPSPTLATTINNNYYFDLNANEVTRVAEVQKGLLSIKYNDEYGQGKEIALTFYDWRHQELAHVDLTKTFGLNYYNIALNSIYDGWENNLTYSCEARDESGQIHTLLFKTIESVKKKEINLNIYVNPLKVDCEELSKANVVYYYGQISGGKAPYEVTWFVINKHQTSLLYQPRKENVLKAGHTPTITITDIPDYYVLMNVKDACGNENQQMVQLVCEGEKEKINTLFVQPLQQPQNLKIR